MKKQISLDDISLIRQTLEMSGEVSFTVMDNDMMPLLRENKDTVTVQKVEEKLTKGDVPLYINSDGRCVLHRVVYVNNGTYVTCGDNLWDNEYNVAHNQVIGVLKSFDRNCRTHNVTDGGYKMYAMLLPVIRIVIKYFNLAKSKVNTFIKFLLNK